MDLDRICDQLCEAERERLATTEICIDEALTIMDRHGLNDADPIYRALSVLSGTFHRAMTRADGHQSRLKRMVRVQSKLTEAFPLSDSDFGQHDQ